MGSNGFTFGIEVLDRCVGMIDRRSMVLLIGPSGSGKSAIASNIAAARLGAGDHVVVFELDNDPKSFVEAIASVAGEDLEKALREGRLRVVDGFARRMFPLRPERKIPSRVVESLAFDDVLEVLRSEASEVRSRGEGLLIVDSFNEIMETMDPSGSAKLLKTIRAVVSKGLGLTSLVLIHTDLEDTVQWLGLVSYAVDGIIAVASEWSQARRKMIRYLQVRKIRGVPHCLEPLSFSINGGLVVPD